MADRVLNFSEFQSKYSEETEQDAAAAYSDMSTAADNFSDGFDEDTYEENPIGPKRPVASGEDTPVQPGEAGAPAFDPNATSGTEFPDEEEVVDDSEETEVNPVYGEYDEDGGGNPEEEDEDIDEDEEDEEDEDEEDEEDEDEESNESFSWGKRVVESFHEFSTSNRHGGEYDTISDEIELIDFDDSDYEDDHQRDDQHDHQHDDECFVKCKACGQTKVIEPGDKPYGVMNQTDPDSWWQGMELGMQCGCNM
jgi:hypothetical protein